MKKSISLFIHSLITVILLCSTSSFSLDRSDSLQFKNDDKITVVKISMPTRQMIRRADLEMHRNMVTSIKRAGFISFSKAAIELADEATNISFYNNYLLQVPSLPAADHEINAWFHAGQLNQINSAALQEADKEVNNQFFQEN